MALNKNIVIIGCGNIGSRHGQSLRLVNTPLTIYFVDPFDSSLSKMKNIWESTEGTHHNVNYCNTTANVPPENFLTIIATNSGDRLNALENAGTNFNLENLILEKFLFSTENEFKKAEKIVQGIKNVRVNCPRRLFNAYKQLKELLNGNAIFSINITGNNWGMCSNSIHFLDTLTYLLGSEISHLSFSKNNFSVVESKRKGYLETYGQLIGKIENTDFYLECLPGDFSGMEIIFKGVNEFRVTENAGNIEIYLDGKLFLNEKIPFQSQLTCSYVNDLMRNHEIGLPLYFENEKLHLAFLSALNNKLNSIGYTSTRNIS